MCGSIIVGNKTCGFEGACEHQHTNVDSVDTVPERVEKTAESLHVESTNSCQNTTELVDKDCDGAQHHRYAGQFHD